MARFAAAVLAVFTIALILGLVVMTPRQETAEAIPRPTPDRVPNKSSTGGTDDTAPPASGEEEQESGLPASRKKQIANIQGDAPVIDVSILELPADSLTADQKSAVDVADRIASKAVRMAGASGEALRDEDRKRMREILYTAEVMRQRYYYSLGTVMADGNVKIQVRTRQIREARKIANGYVEEHALSMLTGSQLNAVIAAQYGELNEDLSIRVAGGAMISIGGVTEADLAAGEITSPTITVRPADGLPLPTGAETP
jgi:uncharacterized membrane protein